MAPRAQGGNRLSPRALLTRVRAVPAGFVAAYSDICPGAPRHAGRVLANCHDASLPWHRIVRANGSLAKGERQRKLLAAEGVPFRGERVDMDGARVSAEALDDLSRSR